MSWLLAPDGSVLHGPAVEPVERVVLADEAPATRRAPVLSWRRSAGTRCGGRVGPPTMVVAVEAAAADPGQMGDTGDGALEGLLGVREVFCTPLTFRTYWRAAASISSSVASGSRPRRVVILRHIGKG